ncbi:MAG: efflux RND transporter periplasmic adaptor subunit [Hyphomicrobium zavarzinii]|jgi:cobalt-zinc-cadmium efflux system membrane fusion protein|uniref:efflux RND transporter periplasmic adaptor subunit n=1 Tax=Hyphomicrobium zavarzinii TaxID=48292 RepID=UPI001A39AE69|nr:efflux RND transporter periplasmic adaptor subunit [Hyphomicrobium zavarzinii]MBL8844560.1 efflux RND transporter periplasmic adaptor subunit [Hyphomicrobium zavarzinii]
MNWKTKIIVAVVLVAVAGTISLREMQSSCAPVPKADAHGHGHGESEQHAEEGFGTKVCEMGVLGAVQNALFSSQPKALPSSPAAGEAKHEHAEGEEPTDKSGDDGHGHAQGGGEQDSEGLIKLSAAQINEAGIEIAPVMSGNLVKEVAVPGRIAINANAQAKIVPKLPGTAARIEKQLGEQVKKGDLLAALESREMADAKAEYLASWRAEELARSIFEREERLWNQRVTAEQDYLTAKNSHQAAKIKLDLAHQRLHTIGLSDDEIKSLPKIADEGQYRFYEIRSPIDGRVTTRDIVLGQVVGTDREIFTIADLAKVWVEMAISPGDLAFAREGQDVRVVAGEQKGTGKIIALSPVIDPETRSAKAIAELDNAGNAWRLGDYVNARLMSGEQEADLIVPQAAIQTVNGNKVVFVSEGGGFRARPVTTGRSDSINVEVLSGLEFGETIATSNTFTLKAELGKSEAEHEH